MSRLPMVAHMATSAAVAAAVTSLRASVICSLRRGMISGSRPGIESKCTLAISAMRSSAAARVWGEEREGRGGDRSAHPARARSPRGT
jgi:hypothetical protein